MQKILLDTLLMLHDLIIQEGGDEALASIQKDIGVACPSWFLWGHVLTDPLRAYPPLTYQRVSPTSAQTMGRSEFFRAIRNLLMNTCIRILCTCSIPEYSSLKQGAKIFKPMIEGLLEINTPNPLPVFTTNYDLSMECMLTEGPRFIDGFVSPEIAQTGAYYESPGVSIRFARRPMRSDVWMRCGAGDVALFHMHGAADCFVDPRTGEAFRIDASTIEITSTSSSSGTFVNQILSGMVSALQRIDSAAKLRIFHMLAWQSDLPCILGSIVPATCKERYVSSLPFGPAYDYFAETLLGARVCVIIGQSCRDDVIKQAILNALNRNSDLYFIVVGKGEPPPHMLDVIPRDHFAYCDTGIGGKTGRWVLQEVAKHLDK